MHDILTLDRRGVAGCAVASEEFRPAAAAQAEALGFEPAFVWVPHPIQNRTTEELAGIADHAVGSILSSIIKSTHES